MFVLDTNVVSELMRATPDPGVEAWVAERPSASLYFSAIGEAELLFGVAAMAAGRRRDALATQIEGMLREDFPDRILPFDSAAARAYATIAAYRRRLGRPAPQADCQIAAIARSRDMAVVTRNVPDFEEMGIDVIDPWAAA